MPSLPVTIRQATAADARLLAEIGARTFSDTFAADNRPEDMAAYLASAFSPEQQAAELADPLSTYLIAEVEGIAAGYALLRDGEVPACVAGERPREVSRLYVEREWIGKGVGEALLVELIAVARRTGARTLWLGVWERNARAQAFYRKWGFREVGGHTFMLGADPQRDILMEKPL